ncbi:FAD/FMN-containing dehydrogenase [Nocardioides scoriae]|uniref:FAD/FMN-containing dehydrogenase n=1 Tax=Nocardioides scoriae TaxID=642780 RepID=A0A1H1TD39_9ACTN|nr:FAD-binding and (Fe-S)-binding domain-containing protein [Nocardioides scoriae]SDS58133.1 FAD/FMN-containing dehydrogenase [Nocardioides scoriae]
MPTSDLVQALRSAGVSDVDDSDLARSLYASDAGLWRVAPQVVVRPRHTDEIQAVLGVVRETGVPLTMRGAGTSIAGNAIGAGIVLDTTRHLHDVLSIDAEARVAHVQPGAVHASLQRQAVPLGLRFGPDPSTHTRCTVGGMIGNNACGSRALGYGRTVDNIEAMTVLLADGTVVRTGPDLAPPAALTELVDAHLGVVRTEFGRFGRQVSGYSFEHLLPERGRRFDRFLAGTEGTLGVVLDAHVRLVEDAPFRALAVLAYPTMAEAADAVPALLAGHDLVACEGLGERIVDMVSSHPELPAGGGWLFAEVTADSLAEADARARAVARTAGVAHRVVTDVREQLALWRIREDGAGLAARSLTRPAQAGWEDAAVPPEKLGAYLRDFDALLHQSGLDGVPYGHFGDGCVHVRIDFELEDEAGRGRYRHFVEQAADLVAGYGGSMSGEHGDGRARSELLPRMYSPAAIALMEQAKRVLDPRGLLNPGVLVDPAPFDSDLRLAQPLPGLRTTLRLTHDHGSLTSAVHRCTGVGKCVADNTGTGGVMCPSYLASREEKDSTRGRAHVLQDVVSGVLDVRSEAVGEALDLCLSCKGCASDCPTGVDMATYKSEVLSQRYAGRLRPRSHYALGQLPRWARMAPARLANTALRSTTVARLAKAAAGVDQRRSLPRFSEQPLRSRSGGGDAAARTDVDVWVWADSFTDSFAADTGRAALELLRSTGLRAEVIPGPACCGLTWITTGQLSAARKIVGRAVETLHRYVSSGVPVVGLEPSCLAAIREDAAQLVDDPRVAEVAAGMRTLAEFLSARVAAGEWTPPDLTGVEVVAQPHCHHHAVLGWEVDAALLARTGAEVTRVGGCCGLAGNFGVEVGHYETSVAVAEHDLLPAVRAAGPDAVVLADGFSCRTQLDDLAGRPALHLAELLLRGAPQR